MVNGSSNPPPVANQKKTKMEALKIVTLTLENIPEVEVIAIGNQGECIVGYISNLGDESGEEFACENDNDVLEEVTHFIEIPKKGVHY